MIGADEEERRRCDEERIGALVDSAGQVVASLSSPLAVYYDMEPRLTAPLPAAGLAAESGAPILPVDATGVPPAIRGVLARLHRPVIYVVGPPAAVSHAVLAKLTRYGPVRRIYPGPGAVGTSGPGALRYLFLIASSAQ